MDTKEQKIVRDGIGIQVNKVGNVLTVDFSSLRGKNEHLQKTEQYLRECLKVRDELLEEKEGEIIRLCNLVAQERARIENLEKLLNLKNETNIDELNICSNPLCLICRPKSVRERAETLEQRLTKEFTQNSPLAGKIAESAEAPKDSALFFDGKNFCRLVFNKEEEEKIEALKFQSVKESFIDNKVKGIIGSYQNKPLYCEFCGANLKTEPKIHYSDCIKSKI